MADSTPGPTLQSIPDSDLPRLGDLVDRTETIEVGHRKCKSAAVTPHRAIIADRRNDRHLGIAQTLFSFLRSHNSIVALCDESAILFGDHEVRFDWARTKLERCYRKLVRGELLPSICEPTILKRFVSAARKREANADFWQRRHSKPTTQNHPQ